MEAAKRYVEKNCDQKGRLKERNLTLGAEKGIKKLQK